MHEYSSTEFPIGCLVRIIPGPVTAFRPGTGIVMNYSSANVYEPSEVQLFMGGETFWIRTNAIQRVTAKTA